MFAKASDVKAGDTLVCDGGFTCMGHGPRIVHEDAGGLYVKCSDGKHYIDGQRDADGRLIGMSLPAQHAAEVYGGGRE